MSSRLTSQEDGKTSGNRTTPDFSRFNVCDSFTNSISSPPDGGEERHRLSRQQLQEAERRLGERDQQILTAIQRYRYLLTSQIQRLYFYGAATPTAAHRAAVRALQKLKDMGLVEHLTRRIGGVRAGSGGLVWYITHAGGDCSGSMTKCPRPSKGSLNHPPIFSPTRWRWRM